MANIWEELRASYWFIPAVMAAAAAVMAILMTEVDRRVDANWVREFQWLYRGGSDGAREVLSTTAVSMLSVAGVTFSITIVALTLGANLFGPRLLRTFMRDRGSQIALGTFIATFLYCLLVLRTVRGENDDFDVHRFVPYLSVTLAVLLAVASLGVLIYFIHHIAAMIQATNVTAEVSRELHHAIDHLYPQEFGRAPDREDQIDDMRRQLPPGFASGEGCITIRAAGDEGYVQHLDDEVLMRCARKHDLLLLIVARPSRFIARGDTILRVWGRSGAVPEIDEELQAKLRGSFSVGPQRSLMQDVLYPIDQLAEMAVRALSPSLNDPFTAAQCVERLGVALAEFAGRALPPAYRADDDGVLRVIAHPVRLPEALDNAFDPIRDFARCSAIVLRLLAEALERVSAHLHRPDDRDALVSHARALDHAMETCAGDSDAPGRGQLQRFRAQLAVLLHRLESDQWRSSIQQEGPS
ncbi:MAG TPA: DUF2254 domain-containing protein [Tepidisphaeraceae bacterium]|nr:DUF2254 domain-containing protein [Tepidisphaeraceae bacterium]